MTADDFKSQFAPLGSLNTFQEWGTHERSVFMVDLETSDPVAQWQRFRDQAANLGCWPLLADPDPYLERCIQTHQSDSAPVAEVLAQAAKWDTWEKLIDHLKYDEDEDEDEDGEWPTQVDSNTEFALLRDLKSSKLESQGPFSRLLRRPAAAPPARKFRYLFVPASSPWEMFAWLGMSFANGPEPAVHVAAHKLWHSEWGCEPVTLRGDTLECRVARRPQGRNKALQLARQQEYYCSDIVYQGVGDRATLAAHLMVSDLWFFWWD